MAKKKKSAKHKSEIAKKPTAKKQSSHSKKSNQAARPLKVSKNIWVLIPLLLAALVFSNSIHNDFVNWDDDVNLYENENTNGLTSENIKKIFTSTIIGNYNPLPIFSFAIEREIFGLNPSVFHFTNLALHLICIFFVFKILMLWKLKPMWATIGAILFAIHPMRVESVAWITERKDVLFGAFFLAAIWQYMLWIRKSDKKTWRYILILALFMFSLLSKIQAVALPLALLCIDYWMERPLKIKLIIEKIPHFLLSLAIGVLGVIMLRQEGSIDGSGDIFGFVDRIFIASFSLLTYL